MPESETPSEPEPVETESSSGGELTETEVEINGLTHTLLLDEEGVKRAEAAKAAAAPANKSATPENK